MGGVLLQSDFLMSPTANTVLYSLFQNFSSHLSRCLNILVEYFFTLALFWLLNCSVSGEIMLLCKSLGYKLVTLPFCILRFAPQGSLKARCYISDWRNYFSLMRELYKMISEEEKEGRVIFLLIFLILFFPVIFLHFQ